MMMLKLNKSLCGKKLTRLPGQLAQQLHEESLQVSRVSRLDSAQPLSPLAFVLTELLIV